jgi:fatty-acyl-CoA synthase
MDGRRLNPLQKSPVPPALLDEAQTVTGVLAALARQFPDYECLSVLHRNWSEERLTLGALWERARAIQCSFARGGLRKGEIVAIVLPTGPELLAAYFGVMLAGGVPALVATPSNRVSDHALYARKVGAILENARAHALYGDEESAAIFRAHPAEVPVVTRVLSPPEIDDGGAQMTIADVEAEDLATAQYSSGATGPQKGVLLTHRAILNNVRDLRAGLALTTADVSVNWIPLYHDMGLIDAFLLPLLCGCPTVLIPTMDFMREPALWLWAIHHYRGSHAWAPNFAYALCARRVPEKDVAGLDLSSWRLAVSAAEPVLPQTVREFARRFASYGFKPEALTPVYGLAENVTAATAHPVDEPPWIEGIDRAELARSQVARPSGADDLEVVSAGRALPGCEIEIRDEHRRPLPDRHVGTIWLRTNCLFSGYNADPVATARTLVDGWLNTGDRGYLASGHLFFVSRDKDLIVVGGEKYAPHDVESAINRVAGVREGCAVAFGLLNPERGTEDVAAIVETRLQGERELADLEQAIRAQVTHSTGLALRYILLVPPGGIEKTTSGKLARGATRRRYADHWAGNAE